MTFKEMLQLTKGATAKDLWKSLIGGKVQEQKTNVGLTDYAKKALEYLPETVRSVAKTGKTGITIDNTVDFTKFREKGFSNWRELRDSMFGDVKGANTKVEQKLEKMANEVVGKKGMKYLTQEEIDRYIKNIDKYTSMVNPDSYFRSTPELAKKNAVFMREYVKNMFELAPRFGMDPRIITAISMAESGWGGTRQGNNLGGYGIMGELKQTPTTNLNYNFDAPTIREGVRKALREYAKGYSGLNKPEQFAGPGRWNANGWIDPKDPVWTSNQYYNGKITHKKGDPKVHGDPNWLDNLRGVMNMIYN